MKCKVEKDISEFDFKKQRKEGFAKQRQALCHDCMTALPLDKVKRHNAAAKIFRENNTERLNQGKCRVYREKSLAWKILLEQIKTEAILAKGGCCNKCKLPLSNEFPVFCFDFHHRDPETKTAEVGRLLADVSRLSPDQSERRIKLQKELDLCDVLCAICHRKVHHEMRNKNGL